MAELFRIPICRHAGGDEWYMGKAHFCWDDDLRNQVELPAGLGSAELVAHTRPSQDRFACTVRQDNVGRYVIVRQIRKCDGKLTKFWFFDKQIVAILKRHTFKDGDMFWVQVEFDSDTKKRQA